MIVGLLLYPCHRISVCLSECASECASHSSECASHSSESVGAWVCRAQVSNHGSLRYRNAVYRSLRELALSYLDDYMVGGRACVRA
jgi:hypothetical protein